MKFFKCVSFQRKQLLMFLLAAGIPLLLACTALSGYAIRVFRVQKPEELKALAIIMGISAAPALDFNDPRVADDVLAALRGQPQIVAACIYSRDGRVFAKYQRDDVPGDYAPPSVEADGHRFTNNGLVLFRRVVENDDTLGVVYLHADLIALSRVVRTHSNITALVLLVSIALAFMISLKLQRMISAPILDLAHAARTVAREKNYSIRVERQSPDELGTLADDFNEMLRQIQTRDVELRQARDGLELRVHERTAALSAEIAERKRAEAKNEVLHRQLLDTSRAAGMAEVATSVLHNVGNVLNSVNVSTTLVSERVRKSRILEMSKAAALLREHTNDLAAYLTTDSKGSRLPDYLTALARHLGTEQTETLKELESLTKNIEHIKDIVAMQQRYARVAGVVESVPPSDLAEDALGMNAEALSRHEVQVIRDYAEVPPVTVDRHKVLQILVNLIRNAKYALDEGRGSDKRLTLRVGINDDTMVNISVSDNGVGIPPDNLTRIFEHGFTTRRDGHGFGLHSGALAAREMGGTLTAHSGGPGKGATFTLTLPHQPKETRR